MRIKCRHRREPAANHCGGALRQRRGGGGGVAAAAGGRGRGRAGGACLLQKYHGPLGEALARFSGLGAIKGRAGRNERGKSPFLAEWESLYGVSKYRIGRWRRKGHVFGPERPPRQHASSRCRRRAFWGGHRGRPLPSAQPAVSASPPRALTSFQNGVPGKAKAPNSVLLSASLLRQATPRPVYL